MTAALEGGHHYLSLSLVISMALGPPVVVSIHLKWKGLNFNQKNLSMSDSNKWCSAVTTPHLS